MTCSTRVVGPLVLLFLGLLLLSCQQEPESSLQSPAPRDLETSASVAAVDPCALALVPHPGSSRVDQDIRHFQEKARQAAEPTPYLERLGWAFVAKARRSFDAGFYTLAEHTARCIAARRPDSEEALLLQGHALHNLHQFREAESLAQQLVRQRGLWFDYGLLGDVLMEQGKLTEAAAAYQHMMDQKPGPQAYSRAAHMRWLTGDLPGALAIMRLAVGSFHDPEASAWAQVRLALYEFQAGRTRAAMDALDAVLASQPHYAPALLAQGRVFLAQGQLTEATTALKQAVQLNPLPEYQWALLEALQAAGQPAESAVVAAQLAQHGANTDRRTYALYLATSGRDSATAVRLAEAERAVRADVFTLDALAWALYRAGQFQEARQRSQQALAVGTQDARLFYHAGIIAAAAGQPAEAATRLAQATAVRQMLLPSEREHLVRASAALPSQTSSLSWQSLPETMPTVNHLEEKKP